MAVTPLGRVVVDHSKMKLGKHAARHDPRTLLLANYLTADLGPAPVSQDWTAKVKEWPMFDNDTIGDCTCAAAGHMIEAWTASAATEVDPTDAQILAAYEAISGYVPGEPGTDRGANELDVLKYWRTDGIAGHQIQAFVAVEPKNHEHLKDAVWLFGGAYLGLSLPTSAQKQVVWSVPPGGPIGAGQPGSWGGHAVPVVEYDAVGLTVVTWGMLKRMTWTFLDTYCDEAYAILSGDFIAGGKAPNGVALSALEQDLQAITG